MTSRERVRKVLNHQLPDRIPNGLGGCETVGLHLIAYDELQKLLGVKPRPPKLDTFMTNAVFEEPVIRAMDGDIILLASPNMCGSQLRGDVEHQWKEQRLWGRTFSVSVREQFRENSDGTIAWVTRGNAICPEGMFYFDYKDATDLLADFGVPDPDTYHPRDTLSEELLRHLGISRGDTLAIGDSTNDRPMFAAAGHTACMGEGMEELKREAEFITAGVMDDGIEKALKHFGLI